MRTVAALITGLGDAALLLPAAALLLLYLVRTRSWQTATSWVAVLTLCAGLTVVAKMVFHACGGQFPTLDIRSPSGHTSLSTTFYGCGALMLSAHQSWGRRVAALLASVGLSVAIAASRVALHAHTIEEAAAGFAIGLLCVGLFATRYLPRAVYLPRWPIPAMVIVALALLTHGRHLSVEGLLDRTADRLRLAQYLCPLSESTGVLYRYSPPGAATLSAGTSEGFGANTFGSRRALLD
ncbi:MAG TPA: phosphatase PAP2 family protein [Stellaceae bacterium]|nr:phosphatase PAP2 family protein [Stellaceae bacterium]